MVEIHEPTRLAIVVVSPRDRLWRVVEGNAGIERLVRNRWVWLACLAGLRRLWELRSSGFVAHTSKQPLAVVVGESASWYQGKRGFLPPVAIVDPLHPERTSAPEPRHDGELALTVLVLVGIASPALLFAVLGGASLFDRPPPERWTGWLAGSAMTIASSALVAALIVHETTGSGPQLLSYGAWSVSHEGGIAMEFLVDRLSLAFAALSTAIVGIVAASPIATCTANPASTATSCCSPCS